MSLSQPLRLHQQQWLLLMLQNTRAARIGCCDLLLVERAIMTDFRFVRCLRAFGRGVTQLSRDRSALVAHVSSVVVAQDPDASLIQFEPRLNNTRKDKDKKAYFEVVRNKVCYSISSMCTRLHAVMMLYPCGGLLCSLDVVCVVHAQGGSRVSVCLSALIRSNARQ